MAKIDRKNTGEAEGSEGHGWMVTFSDLSTLLLTFFVLLLSMSSMNHLKMRSMFHNFTSSCGILGFKEYGEIAHPRESLVEDLKQTLRDTLVVKKDQSREKEVNITSAIHEELFKGASGSLVFQETPDGFKLVFGQEILFRSGSAQLKEQAKPLLDRIAKFMRLTDYRIYIDGYTDNVPIHTERYPSNEALSLARAYRVMRYFVRMENLPQGSIAIGGYGDARPLASNSTEIGRSKNRRVEMIFKNQKYF